jgi:3-phenylpropionate/trans-cinnamate dioxygenase ferredoxin component
MAEFVTVGKAEEVAEGAAKSFPAGGQEIAVARVEGELLAFSDVCTHLGCNLANGEIEGSNIECECHGSVFDMKTGAVANGPATLPVATFEVRDQDGDLQINV